MNLPSVPPMPSPALRAGASPPTPADVLAQLHASGEIDRQKLRVLHQLFAALAGLGFVLFLVALAVVMLAGAVREVRTLPAARCTSAGTGP